MWSFRARGNAQSEPVEAAAINPPAGQPVGNDTADDMAMETLNVLLKTYGRHAFDVEDTDAKSTRESCEKWAKHLQYGGASPASREESYLNGARDWHGVKSYFQKHRQREEKAVSGAMKDPVFNQ